MKCSVLTVICAGRTWRMDKKMASFPCRGNKASLAIFQHTKISFDQKAARSTALTSAPPKPCSLRQDTGKYFFPPWLAGMCSWGFLHYTRRILFHWSRGLGGGEREGVRKPMLSKLPWHSVWTEIVLFHPHYNPGWGLLLFPIYRWGNYAHSGVVTNALPTAVCSGRSQKIETKYEERRYTFLL